MNHKIISEFERLIAFINNESEKTNDDKIKKTNSFRLKQLKNILNILKKYSHEISLNNLNELKEINGIGKNTIDRIIEILSTGSLKELGNFKISKEKDNILEELQTVVGIGYNTALEFYNNNIKTVKELKKKIKSGEIQVNDKIMLGLKYYGKFEGNIPRNEIKKINTIIKGIIKIINKETTDKTEYIYEICGSFRREKPTSGDIDILISKKGKLNENVNYLENIIKMLKTNINKNNNKPLLIDDLTDKNIHTKYMGFLKYLDNPPRRVDIRFVPYDSYYSALVYFTGSADLNKKMRQIAKTKKLKLSEYGLFKEDGTKIPINSEHELFDILNLEYLQPKLR